MKPPPGPLQEALLARSPELLSGHAVPRFEVVADLVGVSRATLYYYFSGQDDLLAFLLRAHVAAGAEVIERADPGGDHAALERLREVLVAVVDYLGAHPGVCAGLLEAAASRGRLADVLAHNDELIAGPIRALIAAGASAGELAVADPHDATNVVLGGALLAVLARQVGQRRTVEPGFADALVHQLLAGIIAG